MNFYTMAPSLLVNMQTSHSDTISALLLILSMVLPLSILLMVFRHQAGEGKGKQLYIYCLLSILAASLLILTKGISITALKGFILFLILLQASVSDIKTRQVSDALSVMILLTALIQADLNNLPGMFLGLLIVGIPQLIIAAAKPGSHGGADIKITASAAFLLGPWKGLFALIIGLLAAILIPSIIRLIKKQSLKEGIPMIPYLSFGILLAFIL